MTAVDITAIEMTRAEEDRLTELEQVVTDGIDTVFRVGKALAEIRDSKLYRQTHTTFSNYLNTRWSISESRGYQLIDAARISTTVEAAGLPAPTNEAQTRPLSGLNDPQVLEAYQKAVEASNGKPTAQDVARARETVAPKPAQRKPLPDAWRTAVYEFTKAAERLKRLVDDDRFPSFAASGDRSISGPFDRPSCIILDLAGFLDSAVRGEFRFDKQRGWYSNSQDEDHDLWTLTDQHDRLYGGTE